MPSPFPGMDPFLEHPAVFPDLHDRLVTRLSEALQAQLPEPYYAVIGSRIWVEFSGRSIGPDVKVLRPPVESSKAPSGGGVAVAPPIRPKPVVVRVPHDERRETFVEIYTKLANERLVTVLEVLSLTNKTPGEHGRNLYLQKQREVLSSQTHLVEIDLLRGGTHTTAVPLDLALEKAGPFDYHVCVHRFDNLEDYVVYPIRLEDRLPEILVPLLPGDPAVPLDLQAVFDPCYDTGPYRRRLRYGANQPVPPLPLWQVEWTTRLLREKGLLPPEDAKAP
jgi:hypothetical protein